MILFCLHTYLACLSCCFWSKNAVCSTANSAIQMSRSWRAAAIWIKAREWNGARGLHFRVDQRVCWWIMETQFQQDQRVTDDPFMMTRFGLHRFYIKLFLIDGQCPCCRCCHFLPGPWHGWFVDHFRASKQPRQAFERWGDIRKPQPHFRMCPACQKCFFWFFRIDLIHFDPSLIVFDRFHPFRNKWLPAEGSSSTISMRTDSFFLRYQPTAYGIARSLPLLSILTLIQD